MSSQFDRDLDEHMRRAAAAAHEAGRMTTKHLEEVMAFVAAIQPAIQQQADDMVAAAAKAQPLLVEIAKHAAVAAARAEAAGRPSRFYGGGPVVEVATTVRAQSVQLTGCAWLMGLVWSARVSYQVLGDLEEEFRCRWRDDGHVAASKWYWKCAAFEVWTALCRLVPWETVRDAAMRGLRWL